MRGKVDNSSEDVGENGITPAYAGKSLSVRFPRLLLWDHPRVCGEKQIQKERRW